LPVAVDQFGVGPLVVLGEYGAGLAWSVSEPASADGAAHEGELGHGDRMAGEDGVGHRDPSCQEAVRGPVGDAGSGVVGAR
jgi:hypothetical protein